MFKGPVDKGAGLLGSHLTAFTTLAPGWTCIEEFESVPISLALAVSLHLQSSDVGQQIGLCKLRSNSKSQKALTWSSLK